MKLFLSILHVTIVISASVLGRNITDVPDVCCMDVYNVCHVEESLSSLSHPCISLNMFLYLFYSMGWPHSLIQTTGFLSHTSLCVKGLSSFISSLRRLLSQYNLTMR